MAITEDEYKAIREAGASGQLGDRAEEYLALAQEYEAYTPTQSNGDMSWSDVGSQAIDNFGDSALQLGKDTIAPFLSPIETAKNVYELGSSIVSLVLPDEQGNEQIAREVGDFFVKRYGGANNIKKTIAEDPAGFLADASTVLTAGAGLAAKIPGAIGKTSKLVGQTSRYLDPITTARTVAAKAATEAIGHIGTGTGSGALREAFKSGKKGGAAGKAFRGQLTGSAPTSDVVRDATDASEAMRRTASNKYKANMEKIGRAPEPVDMSIIDGAVESVLDRYRYKGRDISGAGDVAEKMKTIIDEYKKLNPDGSFDVLDADALKRELQKSVVDSIDPVKDRAKAAAASEILNEVRGAIDDVAPDYKSAMADYSSAMDELNEVNKELLGSNKSSMGAKARKLQKIFRNNANTSYGQAAELGDTLSAAGRGTLMPGLAGQSLQSLTPRGISKLGMTGTAAGGIANPFVWGAVPFQSPLTMGAMYHAGGAINRVMPGKAVDVGLLNAGRLTDEEEFPSYLRARLPQ